MKKLIPKHQSGRNITLLFPENIWDRLTRKRTSIVADSEHAMGGRSGVFFTKSRGIPGITNMDTVDEGGMYHQAIRDDNGNIVSISPTKYIGNGKNLEKQITILHIKDKGKLPWWYEGSPENPYELNELQITPNKNRFLLKRLEGGLLDKIKLVGTELGKAALPGYYTWESGKEVYNDIMDDNVPLVETLKDTGKFILNAGLDGITLIPGGAAITIPAKTARAAKAGVRGVQAVLRANGAFRATNNYMRAAKTAAARGNRVAAASNRTAATVAKDAEVKAFQLAKKYGRDAVKAELTLNNTKKITKMWPEAVYVGTVGKAATNSQNSVLKRKEPYLYNDFTQ